MIQFHFHGEGNMTPVSKADVPSWRNCYTAAVFQDDATKLPALIARAESEIVARARLLFETPGDNTQEVRALHNALHMLEVLKLCIKAPQSRPLLEELPSVQPSMVRPLDERACLMGAKSM
jgi:hypothetical protein